MSRLRRLSLSLSLYAVLAAVIISPTLAVAEYTGGDHSPCETCPTCCQQDLDAYSKVSLTEGNFVEDYSVVQVRSAFGSTIDFELTYNSYNADGSRASIDTVMGYGWTHTYNDFLFSQRGDMFRMGPDGRITRFALSSNGTYVTTPGYFETLVNNLDGSFTITTKYQTKYRYQSIPDTHFLVDGPVLRLTSITDRNNNVTTLIYTAGDLTSITDTYGRRLILAYNSNHHLMSVTDPLNHVTRFSYNLAGCLLTTITDPLQKTTSFTYNALFQMTSKTDRDGRLFTMQYRNALPYAELDGKGGLVYALTNSSNWAIDHTQLELILMRVYIPSTTTRKDGRGNDWTYTYDSNGHPLTVTAPDGATTTYTYDPVTLQIASIKDADNHPPTLFTYDAEGNLHTRTDALGHVTTYQYDSVFNQLLRVTDPQGRPTVYTIDGRGNRLSETDPLMHTQSWEYDSHGNVVKFTDKNNNPPTTYTYDAYGNHMEINQPLMDVTQYIYDIIGNMTSMIDADNNPTTYQYDALYRLTLQTDALNGMKQYFYDGEGDKIEVIDEDNHPPTFYAYDHRRRLMTVTDALNGVITYTYDNNNNRVSMTDQNEHPTMYVYDLQNRLKSMQDALGDTTNRTYDPVGNLLSETDANNHTTSYLYDDLNRRTTKTDALNEITTWGYDSPGVLLHHPECTGPTLGSNKITKQTDGNEKVIYYCYDGLDRLIIEIHKQGNTNYEIDPNDAVTYYTYDPNSNRLTMTEPDGNTITYTFDALNRQRTLVNAAGDRTTWTYDPVGNILTVTWPNGNVTTYAYDKLNRKKTEDDSDGHVSTWIYDAVGNVLSKTDGDNHPTSYTYDVLNREETMTDALDKVTQYFYDSVGNLLKVIDRNGNPTTYTYDKINRRVTMTDAQQPVPATTMYQYDHVGNLRTITDANVHVTTFTYDKVNRRRCETYPDHSHNTVCYTYDAVGNRSSRTDQKAQVTIYTYSDLYFLTSRAYPSGTDIFTYDLSGRILTANTNRGIGWNETFAYDGADRLIHSVQNGRNISYLYNIPGRTRTLTYPGGRTIVEQIDFRDFRLVSINDGGSNPIVQYAYDAANNVLTRGFRNGTLSTYNYNADNWICSLNHNLGPNLIVGFAYAYDNEGNKFFEQKGHELNHSQAYTYDLVYRLNNSKEGLLNGTPMCDTSLDVSMPITQTSYNLDLLGNWNSIVVTPGGTQTRTHSPSNEITSINGYPGVHLTVASDNNGNTSDDGTNLYSYDEENRLVNVAPKGNGNPLGQYQYDAFGRRASKTDNFGVQTFYYYDWWRTIEEQSSGGLTQATYVFGNYLDEALTMDRGGQTFYYHQNALWSVFALTDSTGKGVEGYSYDAYGYQTVILPGPDGRLDFDSDDVYLPGAKSSYGNPFLFTGQRYDPETGLPYYKHRYYSTFFGRFLQRDRLEYVDGYDLYTYVSDRPTAHLDPSGWENKGCFLWESTLNHWYRDAFSKRNTHAQTPVHKGQNEAGACTARFDCRGCCTSKKDESVTDEICGGGAPIAANAGENIAECTCSCDQKDAKAADKQNVDNTKKGDAAAKKAKDDAAAVAADVGAIAKAVDPPPPQPVIKK